MELDQRESQAEESAVYGENESLSLTLCGTFNALGQNQWVQQGFEAEKNKLKVCALKVGRSPDDSLNTCKFKGFHWRCDVGVQALVLCLLHSPRGWMLAGRQTLVPLMVFTLDILC